jgi:sporulation protein YlmC with PRC-barrel domain
MTQRASQLMGKSVVSADTGEKLGAVSDVLLDDTDHRLVGLVVR